jgi:hypothetical protein
MATNQGPYEPCFVPLKHHVAPAENWQDAPDTEPRFRVVRIPFAEDEPMKEYVVPKRSVACVLESFTKGEVYTVLVERA